jgi:hypothetical protein
MEKTLTSIPYPDQKSKPALHKPVALLIGQTVLPLQVIIKVPDYVYIQDTDPLKAAYWDTVMGSVNGIEGQNVDDRRRRGHQVR